MQGFLSLIQDNRSPLAIAGPLGITTFSPENTKKSLSMTKEYQSTEKTSFNDPKLYIPSATKAKVDLVLFLIFGTDWAVRVVSTEVFGNLVT